LQLRWIGRDLLEGTRKVNLLLTRKADLVPTIKRILPSLAKKAADTYKDLESLVSPVGNFRNLRKAVQEATKETALPSPYVIF
jgi:hypothetical protein